MEQLSGLDATFLYMESPTNYGHVGGLQIFRQAEVPHVRTREEDAAHTEYLYSLASYTRRRLVEVPFGLDHPYWVEDPNFDREYHERFLAVPAPGTDRQLHRRQRQLRARGAVDRTMMRLGVEGELAALVHTLDEVHLPQRAGPVQRS